MNAVINLNKARKKKRATEDKERAADNRARFGRTKGEKNRDDADRVRRERALDDRELEKE